MSEKFNRSSKKNVKPLPVNYSERPKRRPFSTPCCDQLPSCPLPFLERVALEKKMNIGGRSAESRQALYVHTAAERSSVRGVAFYGASEFFFCGFVSSSAGERRRFRPSNTNRSPNRSLCTAWKPDGHRPKNRLIYGEIGAQRVLVVRIFFDDSLFEQPLWSALRTLPTMIYDYFE